MQFKLKSISAESIPEALAKVERYRLLNEPGLAESICLDILAIEPGHQQALISLLLARTDQFHSNVPAKAAQEVLPQLKGDYEQAYYAGIIWERAGLRDFAGASLEPALPPFICCANPCVIMRRPWILLPMEMTTPFCAGTPARA